MRVDAPDNELWQRAAGGDGEAFGVLFDRYCEPIRAYCARRTGSLDAADDLTSIVFLEAWRKRADVVLVDGRALPWLYGVAKFTVQRRIRSQARYGRLLARTYGAAAVPDHADAVADRVDDQRSVQQLRAAMGQLRRPDREVALLCLWQGLDYAAAAAALDLPVSTVRSRLARARARLQKLANAPTSRGASPSLNSQPRQELS